MNIRRVALAAVVAWALSLPIGVLVNDVLLKSIFDVNRAALRPDAEVLGRLPIGFAFLLVAYFAFAYVYAKGYEGGSGVAEGARFGVLVSLIVIGFSLIWQYVMYPITASMSAAIIIDMVVEMTIYGAVVGAIYKPLAAGVSRTVHV